MEDLMKEFMELITDKNKEGFKEEKFKKEREENAKQIIDGAEQCLVVISEKGQSTSGTAPAVLAAMQAALHNLAQRLGKDIVCMALADVINNLQKEEEEEKELDIEDELEKKFRELMDKIEKM